VLPIPGDVRRNHAALDSRKVVLGLVVLVVDLAQPAEAGGHHQVRRKRVVVGQHEPAAQRWLVLLAVEWIRSNHQGAVIEAVVAETVPPLAIVQALGRGQVLINGESPDMLNMGVDEGRVALVAV